MKNVLIVEDDPEIVQLLEIHLKDLGCSTFSAQSGDLGLRMAVENEPDLVILDVMLPGKSGFDILQEIRGDGELGQIPVLMLTARGQEKDREMAQRAGASAYMTKPFSNAEVLDAVRLLATV